MKKINLLWLTSLMIFLNGNLLHAESCPSIKTMRSNKLPLSWRVFEPQTMNALELTRVEIKYDQVWCHYTSTFDKEIIVTKRGEMLPQDPLNWRDNDEKNETYCKKGFQECAFFSYDRDEFLKKYEEHKEKIIARKEKEAKPPSTETEDLPEPVLSEAPAEAVEELPSASGIISVGSKKSTTTEVASDPPEKSGILII